MKSFIRKHVKEILILFLIFLTFSFLHIYKLGSVSTTWDEGTDLGIVYCYVQNHDPFGCMEDVSQTRLPYYIHATVITATNNIFGGFINYYVSFVFGLFIIGYLYWFIRKEFSRETALLSTLLLLFSIPQLAMSRMVLTHSNIIFTAWVLLSTTLFYFALRSGKKIHFVLAAVFWGLAVSSSILGVFLIVFFLIHFLLTKKLKPEMILQAIMFICVAMTAFFLSSITYTSQQNFTAFINDLKESRGVIYPYWNYLNLGSPQSPWWFSMLIFVIKFAPWWLAMLGASIVIFIRKQKTLRSNELFLVASTIFLFVYLILKSAIFKYDAPHHQAPFYLFLYVTVAYGILFIFHHLKENKRILFGIMIGFFFCLQIADVIRFFPNYLFYGAQYSKQYIGEFYGPAVLHCHDQYAVNSMVMKLSDMGYKILEADHSCLRIDNKYTTKFSNRIPNVDYKFAFADYLYMNHFHRPGVEEYKKYLAENCHPYYTYYFPTNIPAYQIFQCTGSLNQK